MGSSSSATIFDIMGIFCRIGPNSILDVGMGSGKWGFLFREGTDLRIGKCNKEQFTRVIDGVEIEERIIGNIQREVYNTIYVADARTFVPEREYDMIFMGDVLEHMLKEDGLKLVKRMKKHCKVLIASIPFGQVKHNAEIVKIFPYEKHISTWYLDDFRGNELLGWNYCKPNFYVVIRGELKDEQES